MPSWRKYHSIALVLGTILVTIDGVYLQLPSQNPPLADRNALPSEKSGILYPMKSVACPLSTARHVGCCVGWLHSWDNLRTTQFAARSMRSEQWK